MNLRDLCLPKESLLQVKTKGLHVLFCVGILDKKCLFFDKKCKKCYHYRHFDRWLSNEKEYKACEGFAGKYPGYIYHEACCTYLYPR